MRSAALALLFLASAIGAAAATIDETFANTLVVTGSNGAATRYFLEPGGGLAVAHADNSYLDGGRWVLEGEALCLTPAGATHTSCYPFAPDKSVGDSWTITGPTGQVTVTLALEAGR